MSYSALTTDETTAGKPGKQSLFRKIKDNFDYLYSLIASQSAGAGVPNGSFEIDSDSDGVPDNWTRSLYSGGAGMKNIVRITYYTAEQVEISSED